MEDIRKKARAKRAELSVAGDISARAILDAAKEATQIECHGLPADDSLLDGAEAALDPGSQAIWYNEDLAPEIAAFYQAHEYAHFWLDGERASCRESDLEAGAFPGGSLFGAQRVEGYSPQDRREREANTFARELLLPTDELRAWYTSGGQSATQIAARVGVPVEIVLHQLSRALLLPDPPATSSAAPTEEPGLDESQHAAAIVSRGPLLLEAGPGTGKTRTLIARIASLLGQGVAPTSILALTFSNKAAEEMRARVTKAYPAEAPQIWMGTFHAFGLELLRKFGMKLGLPSRVDVLDPVDALFLLEQELASLALEHYQNLYEPTMYLPAILAAISRAKDELVTPAQYTHLAGEMKSRAQTPDELVAAEKALEVARAYEIYQGNLEQKGLLDFGDLISRSVILLKQHPDIRDLVQKSYSHVLVDEYQDVNRASAVFLQQIAGEGEGLWVVGDVRQAIYRFRGAAPGNMKRFAGDFPGAKFRALERNYRSQPAIIDTFAGLAPQMIASTGHPFTPWTPTRRQEDGGVFLEIAEDDIAEGDGLAREIIRRHKEGLSYRDQAVLCRSHSGLAKIAEALERAGVPAFYLGDVFERPEIRDLLSVLSLTHQGDGRGLVRVAGFPEYQIPLEDVKVLRTAARAQDTPFPRALELAQTLPTLSEKGREGLARLARHLAGIDYPTSPWRALALYLFDRSSYLRSLLREESAGAQQQRLALYQLLQIAHEHKRVLPEPGVDPKRAFLRYIRRLTFFGADTQLRQIPEWAAGIDAVRLLTVHASKGLEFKAVYVPHLAPTRFPANRQSRECPPPDGMIATPEENEHEEEEECLFFVALSRARDYLCLSRAKRYGRRNSNPSRFLSLIAARLPRNPNGDVTWAAGSRPAPPAAPALPLCPANVEPVFTLRSLESYMRCPRQFYYEAYLGLSGRREDTAYMRFHGCVYSVLHWMQDQQAAGLVVDEAEAQTRLAERWEAEKMKDHPYEAIYLRKAKEMISQALKRPHPVGSVRIELEVKREQGSIRFTPDSLEVTGQESEKTVVARRIRTGKPTKSEPEKEVYALYQEGARRAYPGASVTVEIDYLSTGEVVDASVSGKKLTNRLEKYDAAMVGIREKNFAPAPDDHTCPRCPHYFLCPAPDPR